MAPAGWTLPWHGPSQAHHHGPAACPSLAPAVFTGALAHPRLVRLPDRTVTFPSRHVGRARLRPAQLEGLELLRRCLPQVLPEGLLTGRHCGWLQARWARPRATRRLRLEPGHPREDPPPPRTSFPSRVTGGPTCGIPLRVVMRLWTSPRDWVETS
jgi:hypothetical protein